MTSEQAAQGSAEPSEVYFRDKSLQPGSGHGWESHSHAVVTLVVNGELRERFDHQLQACSPFELHFKPAGAPHETATGAHGVRMLLLGLRGSALSCSGLERMVAPVQLKPGTRSARALRSFLALARQKEGEEAPSESVVDLCVGLRREQPKSIRRPPWLSEVHEHLRSMPERRWDRKELARHYRVHHGYLAMAFRDAYGTTISSVLRQARVDRAVRRLVTTDVPLVELAFELGYADQSHFTRDFKRETEWTPARFRRQCRSLMSGERLSDT